MRLDHLLSKENRVFVLSLCGCWLVPGGGKFFCCCLCVQCFAVWAAAVFQVRQVPHACVVCGLGVDETKVFCGLSALLVVKVFAE